MLKPDENLVKEGKPMKKNMRCYHQPNSNFWVIKKELETKQLETIVFISCHNVHGVYGWFRVENGSPFRSVYRGTELSCEEISSQIKSGELPPEFGGYFKQIREGNDDSGKLPIASVEPCSRCDGRRLETSATIADASEIVTGYSQTHYVNCGGCNDGLVEAGRSQQEAIEDAIN